MTDENVHDVEHHLREALQHLSDARESDDLRKTHDVALEEVSNTVSSVLREHEQDE